MKARESQRKTLLVSRSFRYQKRLVDFSNRNLCVFNLRDCVA